MLAIVFMKNLFIDNIERVAFRNNNISSFEKHNLDGDNYKVSLPKGWEIEREDKNIDNGVLEVIFNDSNNISGEIKIYDNINSLNLSSELGDFKNINLDKVINDYDIFDFTYLEGKCYLKRIEERKVVVVKYYYNNKKVKASIEVALDKIVKSLNSI